jgi:CDP-4-dehydro-6-deoxyglucose reductase, E3
MASARSVTLLQARSLSPTVRTFAFRCDDGQPLGHVPGQWLNFDVPGPSGDLLRRAYSIASAPDPERPEQFEIAVTRVDDGGKASLTLHALQAGAQLMVDGPHGFFTREQGRELPALFVGTGTGVCPLRAMLEDELRDPDGPQLGLLFGCRSEADILYREQFTQWARDKPRFSLHVTLSRPSADWSGLQGYVQKHLPQLIAPTQPPHVYVCGLSKMITEVRNTLKQQLGYDRKLIHSERYD